MDEQEFEKNEKLAEIEIILKDIYRVLKPTRWQMFVQGLWRAVGYLVGLVLAIAVVGWFLNIIGLIPFLNDFSENMKDILDIARAR